MTFRCGAERADYVLSSALGHVVCVACVQKRAVSAPNCIDVVATWLVVLK